MQCWVSGALTESPYSQPRGDRSLTWHVLPQSHSLKAPRPGVTQRLREPFPFASTAFTFPTRRVQENDQL